ncbi:MAG TPA: FtsX-like permease family protein [Cyclobacteriaceae bacterium]|nr:FtsX-like permease family protein [Cyclobacteriaceae bacterium]
MYWNSLPLIFRKLARNKTASMVRMLSLVTGITCVILIAAYVQNEFSFDRFHEKADRIVRLTMEYSVDGKANNIALTGTKPGPQFQRTFPSVVSFARLIRFSRVIAYNDKIFDESNVLFADSSILNIFSFPLIAGDIKTAMDGPGKIILTKTMAGKYFGNEEPIGKLMVIGGDQTYMVSGILADIPNNSQISFDFLIPFSNLWQSKSEDWWTANYITYLLLDNKSEIKRTEDQIVDYMRNLSKEELGLTGSDYQIYHLEPFTRVHLYSKLGGLDPNGNNAYVYILIIIAILILAIATINYSNMSIAVSSEAKTEIGIRKILGATRPLLFRHFLGETVLITFTAAIASWVIAGILLPLFNNLSGSAFDISSLMQPWIFILLVIISIALSLVSGAYPAFIIAKTGLAQMLKSGFHYSGTGGNVKRYLILFQFFISIILIITTLVIQQQRKFIRNKNLGYDKDYVAYLPLDNQVRPLYANLKLALKQDPRIQNVSAGYVSPTVINWTNSLQYAGEAGEKQITTRAIPVDLDFLNTLGVGIVAGSDFTEADLRELKESSNSENYLRSYILNETAVRNIGWTPEEAIGRQVTCGMPGVIKAVVRDFHIASLHEPVMPLVIFLNDNFLRVMYVKFNGSDIPAALATLEKTWKERVPARPFEFHFLDEDYESMYKSEERAAGIFGAFSTIAILLACLGLFGLAAITTIQRTREIGIRKALGATAENIAFLVSKEFIVLVVFAFIIAAPVSWFAAERWLVSFTYHMKVPFWVFGFSGMLVTLVSFLTVGYHSVKASLANPVDSLRNE